MLPPTPTQGAANEAVRQYFPAEDFGHIDILDRQIDSSPDNIGPIYKYGVLN